jgi:NAD(P)-dependent dehydrogenase (short-subunit alcohol dehydrogenase family)
VYNTRTGVRDAPSSRVSHNNETTNHVSESKSLQDKVILVTGASQGIGAATASVLGREGARLIAHHRGAQTDLDGAMNTLAGIEASRKHFVAGDFESEAVPDRVWSQTLDAYGHVDVLVLNAAMMVPADDVEDSGDAWHSAWNRHYCVNVLAPARLMHQAVRHFQSRGGGVIIVLSSWVAQRGVTNPRMLAYAASKSAIKAVAQSVARAYASDKIYSYIIAPGIVRTKMSVDFANLQGGEEAVTKTLAMGEWVTPNELGELIAFLATGRVRHLTGATLDVNGATYIR